MGVCCCVHVCQVTEKWPVAAVHICMCVCTCAHVCGCVYTCEHAILSLWCVCVCVCMCVRACVCMCACYVVIVFSYNCKLFKDFCSLWTCLTLKYYMFNFIHLHAMLMVCFKANFLLRTMKYYIYISSNTLSFCLSLSLPPTPPPLLPTLNNLFLCASVTPCNQVNNCDRDAECIYDPDTLSYRCRCGRGFDGDGYTCHQKGMPVGSCHPS